MASKSQKILVLFSASLIMITIGSLYTFGTVIPYLSSYLYYQHHELSTTALSIVYTLAGILMNLGIAIDPYLTKKFNYKQACAISLAVLSSSILVTSYMTELVGFIIFFGIFNGVSIGIGYCVPLKNAINFLPQHKGLCSGICMAAFGFGSIIFNAIIIQIINPQNQEIDPETKRFPEYIANRVPFTFKILALSYSVLGMIGLLLMKQKQNEVNASQGREKESLIEDSVAEEEKKEEEKYATQWSRIKLFFAKKGGLLYVVIVGMMLFPNFIAFAFKEVGFALNPDFSNKDYELTLIGSIGVLGNGISRYIWGYLADKLQFRVLFSFINLLLLVCVFTIQLTSENIYLYGLVVLIAYICIGGMFAILPVFTVKVYGPKLFAKMYWLVFFGFTVGTVIRFLCQVFIINNIEGKQGYLYCTYTFGGFLVISMFVNWFGNLQKQRLIDTIQK